MLVLNVVIMFTMFWCAFACDIYYDALINGCRLQLSIVFLPLVLKTGFYRVVQTTGPFFGFVKCSYSTYSVTDVGLNW